jgi:hypothetical protein
MVGAGIVGTNSRERGGGVIVGVIIKGKGVGEEVVVVEES